MALTGDEPIGSMGTDTALAVLSSKPRLLYDYFKQLFAQVTNPPLDAFREELVTSMGVTIGAEDNLLEPRPEACRQIKVDFPVLHNDQVAKLRHLPPGSPFRSTTLPLLYDPQEDGPGLERAMEQLCRKASVAVEAGVGVLILSDRGVDSHHAPIPSLLAVAGVHHHLVREGTRHKCGLLIETGEAREVHHIALLLGYGAGSVNPYLAFESLDDLMRQGLLPNVTHNDAVKRYIKALNKGVLKVMSKMGISTLQSYCGAQIFEAIGLDRAFVDRYFTSTASKIGGIGVKEISEEVRQRHARAYGDVHSARLGGQAVERSAKRRRVSVAPRRRAAPVQPGHGVQAAARHPIGAVQDLQGIHAARQRSEQGARDAARAVRAEAVWCRRFRSTKWSRSKRSCCASPPARCRTDRSARKRTKRWPSP